MNYYLFKRRYADTYYTVRNDKNVPSIIAFTNHQKAKSMLGAIKMTEEHKQPLVIERLSRGFIEFTCRSSLLPVIIFVGQSGKTEIIQTHAEDVPLEAAKSYLNHKFLYH